MGGERDAKTGRRLHLPDQKDPPKQDPVHAVGYGVDVGCAGSDRLRTCNRGTGGGRRLGGDCLSAIEIEVVRRVCQRSSIETGPGLPIPSAPWPPGAEISTSGSTSITLPRCSISSPSSRL